ncbi:YceI family protein [Aquimarina agarivorans]|uniref:YceI family protein n=1 Tax=Aquimarina agarivorans TaxID=980584 RepID=UPI000248F285|nr:YceI family protein [Aquimarina agarivorans]
MYKRLCLLLLIPLWFTSFSIKGDKYICRNGKVTFFSYATSENIKAENDQVLSLFEPETKKIAVSILMRAFQFEKSLMQEHFNDSYIESDIYPKATFEGVVLNFDKDLSGTQTKIINGDFTLRGISKPIKIKADITKKSNTYEIIGETELNVKDYKIKVPQILANRIAQTVKISFNFKYNHYEK